MVSLTLDEPNDEMVPHMKSRTLFAEGLGTAPLVFFGAGTATLTSGFEIAGTSPSAGVVATALAFGRRRWAS